MARGSILYDVLNFTVCDALFEPLSTDERTMATKHISAFCNSHDICENLIIFDRGYPSAELIDFCFENQVTFLMRTRRKFNSQVDDLTTNDDYVNIGGRKIRVIQLQLDSGETEVLLTNLSDNHNFKDWYFKRWGIEKEFDVIKNTLEIENFSGRTETAIIQDLYINMITCNILSAAYWEAQEIVDETLNSKENEHKYVYKVNVSQAAGTLRDYIVRAVH